MDRWTWELAGPADLTALRLRFREYLGGRQLPQACSDTEVETLLLALEELASNGLRHGHPPVWVTVTQTASRWVIDVTDAAVSSPPRPALDRDPADGGLGLHLVARLCPAHGWAVADGRKHVWACVQPLAA